MLPFPLSFSLLVQAIMLVFIDSGFSGVGVLVFKN